ncbi:hypothetical protein HanOQP8_Chr04g0163241 [Helianthus annuus]|nr:hypothetical protein HanHA89_Chr04g0164861 [Helianthus annuus]KAJ0762608.1 hypothetical protein HanOQP8_Chr04g0163241 [Helianthus annuus]
MQIKKLQCRMRCNFNTNFLQVSKDMRVFYNNHNRRHRLFNHLGRSQAVGKYNNYINQDVFVIVHHFSVQITFLWSTIVKNNSWTNTHWNERLSFICSTYSRMLRILRVGTKSKELIKALSRESRRI